MLINVSAETLASVGATGAADFSEKLSAFAAEHQKFKLMAENSPDISAITKRLDALEARPVITEARITELVTAGVTSAVAPAMTAWAGSDAGKKLIGAEASRIVMEAQAGTGTSPLKPSPAPAAQDPASQVKNLITAGKFEEAYALLSAEDQREYGDAGSYAGYMKNQNRVKIVQRN